METRTDPGTQALKAAETTLYGYDTLDRLTGVAYSDHSVLYRLDAVGNRTGERQTTDVFAALGPSAFAAATHLTHYVTAVFDASDWLISRSDALDATKSASFGYDPNGNLTSKTTTATTRTFLWDARNTLTLVRDNGGQLGNYDYRWDGLRVKRNAQSQQVEYVLDDKFVLSEGDGSVASHGTKRRYHYGTQPLANSEVSGASRFTTWLDTDAQGSVTDATQADGSVRTERQYDAWGNYRNSTAPSATDPKLGYTGHQFDPETGLTYARARYYDSELGIFLSRDPKEPESGDAPWLHRYAYVRANPVRYTDASGESLDGPLDYLRVLFGGQEHFQESDFADYNNNPTAHNVGFASSFVSAAAASAAGALEAVPTLMDVAPQIARGLGLASIKNGVVAAGQVAGACAMGEGCRAAFYAHATELAEAAESVYSWVAPVGGNPLPHPAHPQLPPATPSAEKQVVESTAENSVVKDFEETAERVANGIKVESFNGPPHEGRVGAVFETDERGRTVMAQGRIEGPHPGRLKARPPEPVGGRTMGDHRGHLIPEGAAADPWVVNDPANIISESPKSNLGPKKTFDNLATRTAANNSDAEVWTTHRPQRSSGESRPTSVVHEIELDGQVVHAVAIPNKAPGQQ